MNSPLGHCLSRLSPGILAAPSHPLLPIPQYVYRVGPVQQCHGSLCSGIWLLSHVRHIGSKRGTLTRLCFRRLVGVGAAVRSQPVSGPISSAWASIKAADIFHSQRVLEYPAWDFCPAKGFLLPKCFTAPTFFSNLKGPMWWWLGYWGENNSRGANSLELN